MQNLYKILEIFENFKKILKKFWRNFFWNFPICFFLINFPNHFLSGKICFILAGGTCPHKVKTVKWFFLGGHVPPRPPTDRLWLIRFRDCTTKYECTNILVDKNREFFIEFMRTRILWLLNYCAIKFSQ